MALFICPDLHKFSLFDSIEKSKQSKNHAVLSSTEVNQRIRMLLSQHIDLYPTCTSDEVVAMILSMMEGLNFMMPLTGEDNELHGQSFLIPSLRPVAEFRWNFLQKNTEKDTTLTFGRRVKLRNCVHVHSAWFCSFQVCQALSTCLYLIVINFTGQAYTMLL